MDHRPIIVTPGQGRRLRGPVGGPARLLLDATASSGRFTAIENEIPSRAGPPLHRHLDEDEAYWILDGSVRFRLGDDDGIAPSGSFVWIPRGTPHAFRNDGPGPARLLVLFTPSGMERFFTGLAALPDGPVDAAAYRAIAEAARMEVLGPPLEPPVSPSGPS